MSRLEKQQVKDGLFAVGVRDSMSLMVHSSLDSFGEVEGGADTIIDALLEVLGAEGTLLMPSFSSPGKVFDRKTSPCGLGKIPDVFWRRDGVRRSLHPTHSVAACGRMAESLLEDHEKAETAYGRNTPYMRLIDKGGFVLMMGVDLDRLTLLHTVEALSAAPYLTTIHKEYLDESGSTVVRKVEKMAGPHRDFISLDRCLRENGIMKAGRIGNAVCRLIDAGKMFNYCMGLMESRPDLMLCDNPACGDCNSQRGKIREKQLSGEDFTAAVSTLCFPDAKLEDMFSAILNEGIREVEIDLPSIEEPECEIGKFADNLLGKGFCVPSVNAGCVDISDLDGSERYFSDVFKKSGILKTDNVVFSVPDYSGGDEEIIYDALKRVLVSASDKNIRLLLENGCKGSMGLQKSVDIIKRVGSGSLSLAYNPSNFVLEGGHPFLGAVRLLKHAGIVYVNDVLRNSPGGFVEPGSGNAEIKEVISALRARSFTGRLIFKFSGIPFECFRGHARAFRKLLLTM